MRDVRVLELVSCFLVSVAYYIHAGFANELSVGQVTSNINVDVVLGSCLPDCDQLKPKITRPRKKVTTLNIDDELTIECHVNKTLNPEDDHYPIKMWLCHGKHPTCFDRPPSTLECPTAAFICNESDSESNALSISYTYRVQPNDTGTYFCVVDTSDKNFLGGPNFTQIEVIVKHFHLEIEIVSPTSKFEHVSGEDIIIECHVSKVLLQNENLYKLKMWFCNKYSNEGCLSSSYCLRYPLDCTTSTSPDNASLSAMHIIKNAKFEDSGTYYCVAQADEEYIMPSTVNVSVEVNIKDKVSLLFTKTSLKSIVTRRTNNVDLICLCNGYPEPLITWYKGEKVIQNETKWYSLHNISTENEGQYYCVCKNRLENIIFNMTIDVKETQGIRLVIAASLGGVFLGIIVSLSVCYFSTKCKKKAIDS